MLCWYLTCINTLKCPERPGQWKCWCITTSVCVTPECLRCTTTSVCVTPECLSTSWSIAMMSHPKDRSLQGIYTASHFPKASRRPSLSYLQNHTPIWSGVFHVKRKPVLMAMRGKRPCKCWRACPALTYLKKDQDLSRVPNDLFQMSRCSRVQQFYILLSRSKDYIEPGFIPRDAISLKPR